MGRWRASGCHSLVRRMSKHSTRCASTSVQWPASYTLPLFGSHVPNRVTVRRDTSFALVNLPEPSTNVGVEALVTLRQAPFVATGTYTYVRSRESAEGGGRVDTALTPRHSAGVVTMLESEAGRVGLELYYTGAARSESLSPSKRGIHHSRHPRGEALQSMACVRQRRKPDGRAAARVDPVTRPSPSIDGRWTVDAWAPLEDRVINGGVRIGF